MRDRKACAPSFAVKDTILLKMWQISASCARSFVKGQKTRNQLEASDSFSTHFVMLSNCQAMERLRETITFVALYSVFYLLPDQIRPQLKKMFKLNE